MDDRRPRRLDLEAFEGRVLPSRSFDPAPSPAAQMSGAQTSWDEEADDRSGSGGSGNSADRSGPGNGSSGSSRGPGPATVTVVAGPADPVAVVADPTDLGAPSGSHQGSDSGPSSSPDGDPAASYTTSPDSTASSGPPTGHKGGDQLPPDLVPNETPAESAGAAPPVAPSEVAQESEPKAPAATPSENSTARKPGARVLWSLHPSSFGYPFAAGTDTSGSALPADHFVPFTADESPRTGASRRGAESWFFVATYGAGADAPPTEDAGAAGEQVPVPSLDLAPPPNAEAQAPPERPPEPLTLLGVPVVGALPLDLAGVENFAREALGAAGIALPPDEAEGGAYAWLAAAGLLAGGSAYWTLRRPRVRSLVWRGLGPDSILTDWEGGNGARDQ